MAARNKEQLKYATTLFEKCSLGDFLQQLALGKSSGDCLSI